MNEKPTPDEKILAAISVLNGRDFRYPWLGKWLEKFLGEGYREMESEKNVG